ncbi:hypothetical protein [Streptomyces hokutonensis]|uniref:hypothetical protein n=1 Tax=Streptomyces hokutonensis TaxID=1306990 RepID=UPI0033F8D0D2
MPSHRRRFLAVPVAALTALAVAQAVTTVPAVAAPGTASDVSATLPARTTSVPVATDLSGSGQAVVWRQTTAADTVAHGWLAVAGGTPQDLGRLADTADTVTVHAVSVQGGVVATATSATFGKSGSLLKPVPGVTYRFYVRAHDDAGRTGAWSRTATTGIPLDDRATALHYTGTWKSASATAAWAGTVRTSATKGAYVSFTANGTQLRVVATKKSNGGRFAVVVDGKTVGTVNTYAAKTAYRQVVFTATLGTTVKSHKVQLRVLAGSTSARSTVTLDGVLTTL